MEKNLTSGSVLKSILFFSLPYLLSYFLQTLYGMADLFIIGQFEGVASTTAVSIGSQVMHMITVMIVGLAMGATVTIGLTFGLIVAVAVQFIAPSVVRPFTSDEAVVLAGVSYIRGYIFDCLFAGVQFSFSGYFCAYGKSGLSFLHNTLSILLVRVPGAYLASKFFPQTLLPMGLASACGSLFSILVCVIAYHWLKRQQKAVLYG